MVQMSGEHRTDSRVLCFLTTSDEGWPPCELPGLVDLVELNSGTAEDDDFRLPSETQEIGGNSVDSPEGLHGDVDSLALAADFGRPELLAGTVLNSSSWDG